VASPGTANMASIGGVDRQSRVQLQRVSKKYTRERTSIKTLKK